MRSLFAFLLLVHGAVHVLVFLSSWGVATRLLPSGLRRVRNGPEVSASSTALRGACWLAVAVAITVAGATAFGATLWWPTYTAAAVLCSVVLALVEWEAVPAARLGALLNAAFLVLLWTSHLLDLIL